MTKFKVKFYTLIVVIGVLALGPVVFKHTNNGKPRKTDDRPGMATVTVIWTPSPRETGVRIQVWVDGTKQLGDFGQLKLSAPFHQAFPVPRGKRIEVHGIMGAGKLGTLSSSIMIAGAEVVNDHIPKAIAGSKTWCWAVMP